MQLKAPKTNSSRSTSSTRSMASLKDDEQQQQQQQTTNRQNNNHSSSGSSSNSRNGSNNNAAAATTSNITNNNNDDDQQAKREALEARKQALEQRLSEKSWLLQQIQKQETAIMHGNYEHMTINEFFAQLAQQYKHEQELQALAKESTSILRRKQSTTSRDSQQLSSLINNNNNNRLSETHSNRSSEYDNYQPSVGSVGDMLVIGVAQQQQQQQPHVKSALKKRPNQMQYITQAVQRQHQQQQQQQQQQHLVMLQQHAHAPYQQQHQSPRSPADVISLYSANSGNVATLRQPHLAPQQQPIIVQCDKYYLSPTHQSYTEGGFIKSSQNIKKYVSPMASPSSGGGIANGYEPSLQHQQHQRQLDAISLAPSYVSVDAESVVHQSQQFRWRSQSHIAPLTPPQGDTKSHSSDMLSTAPMPRYPNKPKPLDEISLSSSLNAASSSNNIHATIEKKPKPKQWLESSLDGPVVIRQMENNSGIAAVAPKPRAKLSSQSMSVAGRHYSMSSQRSNNYPTAAAATAISGGNYASPTHSDDHRYTKLSQSTSYLNAIEQKVGISESYALEPLDIPPFRNLPPKPNQSQQPTPPPRPPPAAQHHHLHQPPHITIPNNSSVSSALVSPPLAVVTASLSPDIRIESPKNMTIVQQATFQPYKEVTKPFEMSDFYKYSTKFKQKETTQSNHH